MKAQLPVVETVPEVEQAGPSPTIAPPEQLGPLTANAVVVYVTDGDTVIVRRNGSTATEHARLIGIDTPESKRPNTPVECFAKEASHALESVVPAGTRVRLEFDVEERDRYDRLLVYVFRAVDGLNVNREMVRTGMAAALSYPPNVRYTDEFRDADRAARARRIGLWSACESGHEPTPPASVPVPKH